MENFLATQGAYVTDAMIGTWDTYWELYLDAVPPNDPRVSEEDRRERIRRNIVRDGFWLQSDDDIGKIDGWIQKQLTLRKKGESLEQPSRPPFGHLFHTMAYRDILESRFKAANDRLDTLQLLKDALDTLDTGRP